VEALEHRGDAVAEMVVDARAGGEGFVAGSVEDERVAMASG